MWMKCRGSRTLSNLPGLPEGEGRDRGWDQQLLNSAGRLAFVKASSER